MPYAMAIIMPLDADAEPRAVRPLPLRQFMPIYYHIVLRRHYACRTYIRQHVICHAY